MPIQKAAIAANKICDLCCSSNLKFYAQTETLPGYWLCVDCRAGVSCHKGNPLKPMGKMADKHTRRLRSQAHSLFDKLWQNGHMTRNEAYDWLARKLGKHKDDTHIANMYKDELKNVIAIVSFFIENSSMLKRKHRPTNTGRASAGFNRHHPLQPLEPLA